MQTIRVQNDNITVYDIQDFPYEKFATRTQTSKYIDLANAFDIETTSLHEKDIGFMYIWQACIEGDCVIGRTWEDFKTFLNKLKSAVKSSSERMLVFYVHNLQFEFQFMRNFFNVRDVFARDKRNVIRCVMDNVEFRCSYALSNMSLANLLKYTKGVKHGKKEGDLDYSIPRYPDTVLNETELGYCICDVLGLSEAIRNMLVEDTLDTIPMTSTGYIRREFREVCLADPKYKRNMLAMKLTPKTYALCKEACRGGIAGSNAINTGWTIDEVDSFDKVSSYPYQMATKYFPMSRFLFTRCKYGNQFEKFLEKKCCLIVWTCENLCLKKWEGIPYISKAKCRAISGGVFGNGKVYSAKKIGMCCTEIDFKIIREHYNFDNIEIMELWVADRGLLPYPFRKLLLEMFQKKTDLKDGDKYLYAKYKNKINAAFGMMLTDILNPEIEFFPKSEEAWKEHPITDVGAALKRYYFSKNSFLSYQHGVWVTAHARADLVEGMDVAGQDLVQTDTDSVKCIGDYKRGFEKINQRIMKDAEKFDVKPYAVKNGKKVYLGIWEHENDDYKYTYKQFKTLGAKKYCYKESGSDKLCTTVSGLRKDAGIWLEKHGSFSAFTTGTEIPPSASGRTSSKYNDLREVQYHIIKGHDVILGSNICINNVSYTLGVTDEWEKMIGTDEELGEFD